MTNKLFVSFIHNGFWDKISKYLMIFQCWISSGSDIQISTSLRYVNILKVDMSGFWNIFFESLNMLTLYSGKVSKHYMPSVIYRLCHTIWITRVVLELYTGPALIHMAWRDLYVSIWSYFMPILRATESINQTAPLNIFDLINSNIF